MQLAGSFTCRAGTGSETHFTCSMAISAIYHHVFLFLPENRTVAFMVGIFGSAILANLSHEISQFQVLFEVI
jgi:hypothetical protein